MNGLNIFTALLYFIDCKNSALFRGFFPLLGELKKVAEVVIMGN